MIGSYSENGKGQKKQIAGRITQREEDHEYIMGCRGLKDVKNYKS